MNKEDLLSITIYRAKKVITMNPSNPEGTHVAVRDGVILGVGSLEEVAGWGDYKLDNSFSEHVIVPGFVEAHAHVMAGGMMLLPYVGYFERKLPDGSTAPGIKSYDALIDAMKLAESKLDDPDQPLVAVGFDPIYFPIKLGLLVMNWIKCRKLVLFIYSMPVGTSPQLIPRCWQKIM